MLAIVCTCCHTSLLGDLSDVHMTPLGEGNWNLAFVSPVLYPKYLFPLVILIVSFHFINHNHGYNRFTEFSVNHQTGGWSWGPPARPHFTDKELKLRGFI